MTSGLYQSVSRGSLPEAGRSKYLQQATVLGTQTAKAGTFRCMEHLELRLTCVYMCPAASQWMWGRPEHARAVCTARGLVVWVLCGAALCAGVAPCPRSCVLGVANATCVLRAVRDASLLTVLLCSF